MKNVHDAGRIDVRTNPGECTVHSLSVVELYERCMHTSRTTGVMKVCMGCFIRIGSLAERVELDGLRGLDDEPKEHGMAERVDIDAVLTANAELKGTDDLAFSLVCSSLKEELRFARAKFPGNRLLLAALTEEVGELSKVLLQKQGRARVRAEAVQVMCVAARILLEGPYDKYETAYAMLMARTVMRLHVATIERAVDMKDASKGGNAVTS